MSNNQEPGLVWTVEPGEHATVVHISGEIDMGSQPEFADAVSAGLDSAALVVILNLGEVAFLGSVGLRVLVQADYEAKQAGRQVRVVDGATIVHRVIEVTGLDQVLSLYPTIEDARSA
ncbi:anti-anti-sigma factor [Kibdelosporangium aridum]|uniref:Anti-sigma factor antagonist n=1 Tax=Kibdelosporangium aridum TaxID=2030 RepID=A0A1W2FZ51_KIBAR|nr:anti-anti-sigma factor [Kibdelosporangium aridum]